MSEVPATDNPVGYISHHLEPLSVGTGFWTINIDSMFFGALIASIVMFISYWVGKNITTASPQGMQNILETLRLNSFQA